MAVSEIPLLGARITAGIVRVDDTVRRPISGDRTAVHALLRHLEAVGFDGTPRFLGIDETGREILSFLPGSLNMMAMPKSVALPMFFEHLGADGFSPVSPPPRTRSPCSPISTAGPMR